jgi:NAD(P)-dependent dehydrogenase (short-subunit alcohol dehydrogenase family)
MLLNELEKVTEQEFDKTFNLNVKGPLFLAQVSALRLPFLAILTSNRKPLHT